MEEFIVAVMFTLPGRFVLTCLLGEARASQRSTSQIVVVSTLTWIIACLTVYAVAYAIASALQPT